MIKVPSRALSVRKPPGPAAEYYRKQHDKIAFDCTFGKRTPSFLPNHDKIEIDFNFRRSAWAVQRAFRRTFPLHALLRALGASRSALGTPVAAKHKPRYHSVTSC